MDYDDKKRGYLLPEGCKDLMDVLKLKAAANPSTAPAQSLVLPPIVGEITVAEQMTVRELAVVLQKKPFQIIADLIDLRVMANVNQPIPFEIIAQVARRYGYMAKKAA